MTSMRSFLFATAGLVLALVPAVAQDVSELQPNRVRTEYVSPKNPVHQPIYDRLRQRRVLERIAEFLAPFRLPRELPMKIQGCDGVANAFYEDEEIKVCYEYLDQIRIIDPNEARAVGLAPEDLVIGPTVDVFLHEFAHALFDMLEIPVLGREEDAADLFSAYIQLQIDKDEARLLITGVAFLGRKEMQAELGKTLNPRDFAKEHGLTGQRYFNVLCMAYGFDQHLFADAIEVWKLPPQRAEYCDLEYQQFERAFRKLIAPYVDEVQFAAVRGRKWLQFETQGTAGADPRDGTSCVATRGPRLSAGRARQPCREP
jgi:hypothetical protein